MPSNSDKKDVRNAKRTASKMQKGTLRLSNSAAKAFNKESKADLKAGKSKTQVKVTSSTMRVAKTNSAKKTGVANKMKTQGKPAMQSGKGYMRSGKK
jgi:hypothetical protein